VGNKNLNMNNIKSRLLIIHPEGNIFNNPNLYSIIQLYSQHYNLDVLIPRIKENKDLEFNIEDLNIIEYASIYSELNLLSNKDFIDSFFYEYIKKNYDIVIGVDRLGLILAYLISNIQNIPYGSISYEIFFKHETSYGFKDIEIIASKNVSFVVIQDSERARQLSNENKIPLKKMIYIPVASSIRKKYTKTTFFHEEFKLGKNIKILLFMGSISKWSCIDKILSISGSLPKDWVIVFHDRYGDSKNKVSQITNIDKMQNVYFSNMQVNTTETMYKLVHNADIGLALYCPDFSSIYTGDNLKYIGFASGKISTYLQNGLPVITTKNDILSKKLSNCKAGFTINNMDEIIPILEGYRRNTLNNNAIDFFDKYLNFDNYKTGLLELTRISSKREDKYGEEESLVLEQFTIRYNEIIALKMKQEKQFEFVKISSIFYSSLMALEDKSYIIYGYGTIGKIIQAIIPEKIVGYVDIADKDNHPEKLQTIKYDKIIISVLGREESIIGYLVNQLSIKKDKIVTLSLQKN